MRIYLDNNATTPIHPAILESLGGWMRETFGNASSVHAEGQRARQLLEEARDQVAGLLGAVPREVLFTSGGTESNNAALFGSLLPSSSVHIVSSAIEHPSVLAVLEKLRQRGNHITLVPPRLDGSVDPDRFRDALTSETRLATLMLANNETGVVQDVVAVAAECRARGIFIHCDAVQAAGKIDLDVEALGVDTLAISGHKLHAPKGVGALYVRSGSSMRALMVGGAQERRRRAGTENVPLAAALGAAATLATKEKSAQIQVAELRDRIETIARERLGAVVNGSGTRRLPNTTNLRFTDCDAEGLVIGLDLSGIAISTGSACSSGRVEPSHVLIGMGLSEEDAASSIRVSLSRFSTAEEIERFLTVLEEAVPKHRKARSAGTNGSHH